MFTLSGRRISAPPKIQQAFIAVSLSNTAFLKSSFIPPNTAVSSAPLNISSSKLISWPENAAKAVFMFSLFSSMLLVKPLFLPIPPKIILIPITAMITGNISFQNISKSRIF